MNYVQNYIKGSMADIRSYSPLTRLHLFVIAATVLLVWLWKWRAAEKLEEDFVARNGCKLVRKLASTWPLGLDRLLKIYKHAKREQILHFFCSVIDEAGNTFEQNIMGSRSIGTVDPENIEAILSTQFTGFGLGLRPPHFFPLLGSGIFTQDGQQWKHSRELLRPQFSQNRLENFEQVKTCVENLISSIPTDGIVDLQPLFFRLTFDTTTYLLFGKSMSALNSEDGAGKETEFAEAFNLAQDYLSHRGRFGKLYWLINNRAFRTACNTCHRFVDDAVRDALEKKDTNEEIEEKRRYIFINALIHETQDPKVLRDQCLNILLAGRDTTACCLSWTFRLLARHPKVLHRLRDEIISLVGLGYDAPQPTRNDLKKMPYLNLIIKEVLRLYPSVPVNSRAALKMTTIPTGGGEDGKSPILVRAGEAVGYCVYAMHRRKDIYGPDACDFRPERWEEPAMKEIGYAYLPFNGGPRICLGQDFAYLEAGYAIVRLIQTFPYIELPQGEPNPPTGEERQTLTLVVAPAQGCRIKFRKDCVAVE